MKITGTILFLVLGTFFCFNYSFAKSINGTNFSKADSIKRDFYLKVAVTVTNKGISYIPNLSLGKPAAIFDLSMGNGKLSFEHQLRFSLNGEPWAFIFPVRYKIKSAGKFQMTAGINPLLNFKNVTYTVNGTSITDLVNRRYLGGEFRPNYFFTKNTSIGAHYLYFYGISNRTVKNTNFVSININFSSVRLGSRFFARFSPQVYYLNQDGKEGFYFNSAIALFKKDFPLSIQTIMNAIIRTNIPGSEKFLWNASLVYAFNKTYSPK